MPLASDLHNVTVQIPSNQRSSADKAPEYFDDLFAESFILSSASFPAHCSNLVAALSIGSRIHSIPLLVVSYPGRPYVVAGHPF